MCLIWNKIKYENILQLRTKPVQRNFQNNPDTCEEFSKRLDLRNIKLVDVLILTALRGTNIKSHFVARSSTLNTTEIVPWIH